MSPSRSIERLVRYVLKDGKAVPEPDLMAWGAFMEDIEARTVRKDFFAYRDKNLFDIPKEAYFETLQTLQTISPRPTPEQAHASAVARKKRKQLGLPIMVSTVFLGVDHNFFDEGPPILWETMVFGIDFQDFGQARYRSTEEAVVGHTTIVAGLFEYAKRGLTPLSEQTGPPMLEAHEEDIDPKDKPS